MSSDDRNKTVFRPSPLRGGGTPPPPPPPPPGGGGWGAPPPPSNDPFLGAPPPQSAGRDPFGAPLGGPEPAPATAQGMTSPAQFVDDVPQPRAARDDRNPLVAHAAPVLAMAAAIQSGRWQVPMQEFHARATDAIRKFEAAIEPLYPEGVRQRAKYAVCATIDDVMQNLPGMAGGGAQWAQRNMVVTFFRENIGGDRFWEFVQEMLRDPARNRDLIELFHACLAAGFEGRTRTMPDGFSKKREVMTNLVGALEHLRSMSQHEIVHHWKGEVAPRNPGNFWGLVALVGAIAAGICFLIYLIFFVILFTTSSDVEERVAGLFPGEPLALNRSAAAFTPPPSDTEARLRQFLAPEIQQGLVEVEGNRVRTTVGTLFEPASNELVSGRESIFERIGKATELEKGTITVEGHADSDRIATIEYPSNIALSEARARTVADIIRTQLSDKSRVKAVGLGDTVPLASNDNAAGKARNRRVEVVLDHGL
ncbi:putative lipoprotein YiaD precursor [Tsuneonella dongtanensis]|uniref:Putative lipoprotein YiaD n=1 Tax=Tsuneonella dongtanensis TaxID=692370 RepID=A0A1B2AB46_9SPHN|nr:type IVB secretion system protein IcmH/DotU [Tsuneonella dongtanensis]ANY19387.1 putative lipoprotein YiaD precursor [Tsuneonella dongtanensis]